MAINSFIKGKLKHLIPFQTLWLPRYYAFFKWIRFDRKELILDAACGEGEITLNLNKKGFLAIGIDRSYKNIKKASEKMSTKGNSKFIVADIKQLPFGNNTFDKIVSLDTLEHIDNDATVFKELHRVLRPDGQLIATIPYAHCCATTLYKEQKLLRKVTPRFLYSRNLSNGKAWLEAGEEDIMKECGHLRNYSIDELKEKTKGLFRISCYEYFLKKFSALATDITYGIKGLWNLRFVFFYIAVRLDYFMQKHKKGYWIIAKFIKAE